MSSFNISLKVVQCRVVLQFLLRMISLIIIYDKVFLPPGASPKMLFRSDYGYLSPRKQREACCWKQRFTEKNCFYAERLLSNTRNTIGTTTRTLRLSPVNWEEHRYILLLRSRDCCKLVKMMSFKSFTEYAILCLERCYGYNIIGALEDEAYDVLRFLVQQTIHLFGSSYNFPLKIETFEPLKVRKFTSNCYQSIPLQLLNTLLECYILQKSARVSAKYVIGYYFLTCLDRVATYCTCSLYEYLYLYYSTYLYSRQYHSVWKTG